MEKKYIIAIDSRIPAIGSDDVKMFVFTKHNHKYDTMEQAEKTLEGILNNLDKKNTYTIIPIYTKS